ncbi:MAG: PAS domain S-box protein [Candidatus Magasanikbacteria bacterium]|nr:PAS domain S-box protein [Candidatus Magasanikbacteria bacterium]
MKERSHKKLRKQVNYKSLFETSRDAIMLLNKKGFFDCNKTTLDLFEIDSVEEFVKTHPSDLSPAKQPDGKNSFEKANKYIKKAFDEGRQFFEWVHKTSSGKNFPAEVLLSRLKIKGEPALQATVRDISKRKKIEKELAKNNKYNKLLVENSPFGIAFHKMLFNKHNRPKDYIFLGINPAFEKLTGLKKDEVLNKKVTDVIPGIRNSNFIKIYGKVISSGKSIKFDQFSKELGRHYSISAYKVGKDKFVTIFEDITKKEKDKKRKKKDKIKSKKIEKLISEREMKMVDLKKELKKLKGKKSS